MVRYVRDIKSWWCPPSLACGLCVATRKQSATWDLRPPRALRCESDQFQP